MAIDDRFIIYSCPHYGLCGQPLVTGECMPHCIKLYDMVMSPRSIERENSRMTERLTIEEVIAHCERRTDRAESFFTREKLEVMPIEGSAVKEYWEHRQVREWLLELQERRKKDSAKTMNWQYGCICSNCNANYMDYADADSDFAIGHPLPNYCPNCGFRNEVK